MNPILEHFPPTLYPTLFINDSVLQYDQYTLASFASSVGGMVFLAIDCW